MTVIHPVEEQIDRSPAGENLMATVAGLFGFLALQDAAFLIAGGIVIGVPVAYALARLAASRFFGVTPGDAASIALAVGRLSVAGFLAAWIPARRAARVDPMTALRTE